MSFMETPRLRLRPLEPRDEAMFCHLYTDPDVMRRILPPLSQEAATQSFQRARLYAEAEDLRARSMVEFGLGLR